jgi:hypothetical protein
VQEASLRNRVARRAVGTVLAMRQRDRSGVLPEAPGRSPGSRSTPAPAVLASDRNAKESVLFDDMGQKLLEAKLIDQTALQKAELQQKNSGGSLTGNLVKTGAITEEGLSEFLAQFYRVPAVNLNKVEADPACVKLLPPDVALKFMALPLSRSGRRLTVAMVNPTNIFALDDIKFITGFEVDAVVAPEPNIKRRSTSITTRPARWPTS